MEPSKSILLQKQVRDNSEDLQTEFLDLKNWEQRMKKADAEIRNDAEERVRITSQFSEIIFLPVLESTFTFILSIFNFKDPTTCEEEGQDSQRIFETSKLQRKRCKL